MRSSRLVYAVVLLLGLVADASADDELLRGRALRLARKMAGASKSGDVNALKNTNFDGVWGGRYSYSSRLSTCSSSLSGFNFQHVFVTRGGSGFLSTNHDGDFRGRSRDKGRRWEFVKTMTVGGRPAALAVVYSNLARNGNTAGTGVVLSISGGCLITYQGSARRMAR